MCGIVGVWNARKAAELTVVGLHGNQHRARDFAGVVSTDGENMYRQCGEGLARVVFTEKMLHYLHGKSALGHIRYPTVADDPRRDNIQPILGLYKETPFAIAHNGNLTNLDELREIIPKRKLTTSLDSEFIVRLLEHFCTGDIVADLKKVFGLIKGSCTIALLLPNELIAVRDKSGNRPLSIGQRGESFFISSETVALTSMGAEFLFDVPAGGMVRISSSGYRLISLAEPEEKKCPFEWIYFSSPNSLVYGVDVAEWRFEMGQRIEKMFPVEGADLVVAIPDSANFYALGYAASGRSGKYMPPILRHHDVGRSFIAADQAERDEIVGNKHVYAAHRVKGKRLVLIDDSIVRGTTIRKVVAVLWELGAREIHLRIPSPPITHPCRYGVATHSEKELIASKMSQEEIGKTIGVSSIKFISVPELKRSVGNASKWCFACMDGKYW